jgi:hypothetical protein
VQGGRLEHEGMVQAEWRMRAVRKSHDFLYIKPTSNYKDLCNTEPADVTTHLCIKTTLWPVAHG